MSKIALEGNASGTGTFTVAAPNTNTNYTITLPQETGTLVTTGVSTGLNASALTTGIVAVGVGGTGANTLTAEAVIIGNTTSAVKFVSPGTNGNVLTSNGTAWVSQALAGGGVTSLNGQTGAVVTTDLDAIGALTAAYYGITTTATTAGRASYIARGTTIAGSSLRVGNVGTLTNSTTSIDRQIAFSPTTTSSTAFPTTNTTTLTGTWRAVGGTCWTYNIAGCPVSYYWNPLLWVRIS